MTATESTQAYQIKEKLASLESALLNKTPDMPKLLQEIHRNLKKDPDLVTVLSERDCSILVKGLIEKTGESIATKAIKKSKAKSAKSLGIDDL